MCASSESPLRAFVEHTKPCKARTMVRRGLESDREMEEDHGEEAEEK